MARGIPMHLSPAPLDRAIAVRGGLDNLFPCEMVNDAGMSGQRREFPNPETAAEYARVDNAIRNARGRGYVTLTVADDIACHVLKMHPVEIWGAEYEAVVWHDINDAEDDNVIAFPVPVAAPVYVEAVAA